MSKDVSAGRYGDRRRMRAIGAGAAAVVAMALVPWVGAEASGGHGWGHHGSHGSHHNNGGDSKLLYFASDGLRQDLVEKYAKQGAVPGFRDLLRKGARLPTTDC